MSAPKHLWSGNWRAESAASARERANRQPDTPEQPAELPSPPPSPSLGQRLLATLRALRRNVAEGLGRLRLPGASARAFVVVLAVLLLIAGAAYGLSRALGSGGSSVAAAGHHTPYLGVQMESVPINRVLVAGVVPNSPAAQAGIGPGDVIIAINNRPVQQPGDVTSAISGLHPGDSVSIQIERGGIPYSTNAKLTSEPSP